MTIVIVEIRHVADPKGAVLIAVRAPQDERQLFADMDMLWQLRARR